jgi:endonuclease/exonuclease/phosphatase family metal-dependent hydrolase
LPPATGMRYTLPVTSRRTWPAATAVALGVVLLTDVFRVFLPSLSTIFASGSSAPTAQHAAFAGLWFALGLLALPAMRRVTPRTLAVVGALGLAICRLVLQGTDGGQVQLYGAALGVTAGVCWLVALAGCGLAGLAVAVGVTSGIAAAVTLHVALRTADLTWWAGAGPWLAVAAAGLGLIATTWLAGEATERETAAAGLWFAVGPALVVAGIVTGSPGRAEAAAGWLNYRASFLLLIACCLAVLGCLRARAWTRSPLLAIACFGLLLAGATLPRTIHGGVSGLLPSWSVWAQAGCAVALGVCLGWAGEGEQSSRPGVRSGAAAAGLVAFLALVLTYYAAYGTSIGVPNVVVLLVAGSLVGLGVLLGAGSAHTWAPSRVRPRRRRQEEFVVLAATCLALIGALTTASASFGEIENRPGSRYPVRLVTYDVRMGYDLRGRFDPKDLAATVRAQQPDVVVLNEVDRGWMINGGHDVLQLIAEDLGMPFLFAPAADEVQGDAVLTRLPILSVHSERISEAGSPTGATALAVVLKVGTGRELGLVATHLQPNATRVVPVSEAERAAAVATGLVAKNRPVVLAGDLGVEPGSTQFAAFGPALVDALAAKRPLPTDPSDHPTRQIDHVLITPDLVATDIQVPASTDSDHRPVAVSLAPR